MANKQAVELVIGQPVSLERPLTEKEAARLAELEQLIEQHAASFMVTATAILEIKRFTLYRATHDTFENYCDDRWSIVRQHAYRLMDAAKVQELLTPMGVTLPNERVAREFVSVLKYPKLLQEVGKKLAAQPKITATVAAKLVAAQAPKTMKAHRQRAQKRANKDRRSTTAEILAGSEGVIKALGEVIKELWVRGNITKETKVKRLKLLKEWYKWFATVGPSKKGD